MTDPHKGTQNRTSIHDLAAQNQKVVLKACNENPMVMHTHQQLI
jgi:hypothetical protein